MAILMVGMTGMVGGVKVECRPLFVDDGRFQRFSGAIHGHFGFVHGAVAIRLLEMMAPHDGGSGGCE